MKSKEGLICLNSSKSEGVISFAASTRWGGSALSMVARVGQKLISVFPEIDELEFETKIKKNKNAVFQSLGVPLFPLANRLRSDLKTTKIASVQAKVSTDCGPFSVRLPANILSEGEEQESLHLHGLLFDQCPEKVDVSIEGHSVSFLFRSFLGGFWSSDAEVLETHVLEGGKYIFSLKATNIGHDPLPVGWGAHPYFQMPSRDIHFTKVHIPASLVAEINNLTDVFPTGKWNSVTGTGYDFQRGASLPKEEIDHYFLLDPELPKQVLLRDEKEKIQYRITGLSKNIIGVQMYYPGHGSVIAIEMVTHHPDPRVLVWGDQPTGIKLLQPGQTDHYSYQVEVISFE